MGYTDRSALVLAALLGLLIVAVWIAATVGSPDDCGEAVKTIEAFEACKAEPDCAITTADMRAYNEARGALYHECRQE